MKYNTMKTEYKLTNTITPQINFRYVVGQYVTVHGEVISHVNISRARVEDGGLYTCVAKNRAGSAGHSARLNIYGQWPHSAGLILI